MAKLVGGSDLSLSRMYNILRGVAEKIQERSPLKYSVVRALQALDPSFQVAYQDKASRSLKSFNRNILKQMTDW